MSASARVFGWTILAAIVGFMLAAFLIKQIDKDRPNDKKLFGRFYSE